MKTAEVKGLRFHAELQEPVEERTKRWHYLRHHFDCAQGRSAKEQAGPLEPFDLEGLRGFLQSRKNVCSLEHETQHWYQVSARKVFRLQSS